MTNVTDPDAQPLILVAEDEDSVRQMVALALKALGFRTVLFPDGAAAAEAIDEGTVPDAVLLDVRMPRMNGIDLVRHIRARAETVATPDSSASTPQSFFLMRGFFFSPPFPYQYALPMRNANLTNRAYSIQRTF